MDDVISRMGAIGCLDEIFEQSTKNLEKEGTVYRIIKGVIGLAKCYLEAMPGAQVKPEDKYEYHYDHTDCIWYRPEARNRCPTTCAQYRDGWNDAMNYIFRDGKGYRPYRKDQKYE